MRKALIRVPALPLLIDAVNTAIAKSVARAETSSEVLFKWSPWLAEIELAYEDRSEIEDSLYAVLYEGARRLRELKIAPVTVGISGDTGKFESLCRELDLHLPEGKLYERTAALFEEFLDAYQGALLDLLATRWEVEVSKSGDKVLLSTTTGRDYMLPSLVRSVSLYEEGRFFGLRDERRGRVSKGLLNARSDAKWWLLSLLAVSSTLTGIERLQEETRLIHVLFEPTYGILYEREDLRAYGDVLDVVEDRVKRIGLYVEDLELTRLTLLLDIYSSVENPLFFAFSSHSISFYGVLGGYGFIVSVEY